MVNTYDVGKDVVCLDENQNPVFGTLIQISSTGKCYIKPFKDESKKEIVETKSAETVFLLNNKKEEEK